MHDKAKYAAYYSNESLADKVLHCAKKAGREVLRSVFQLYYALDNPATPAWAKTVIVGAIGYFISPVDAVPDFLPGIGFVDDFGVLGSALATVAMYVDTDAKNKADQRVSDLFD